MGNILNMCSSSEFDDEGIGASTTPAPYRAVPQDHSRTNVEFTAEVADGAEVEFTAEVGTPTNRVSARLMVFSGASQSFEVSPSIDIPKKKVQGVTTRVAFSLEASHRGSLAQREFFNQTQRAQIEVAHSLSRSSSAEHMTHSSSEEYLPGLSTRGESVSSSVRRRGIGRGKGAFNL